MRAKLLAVVLVGGALALAACGGGGASTTSSHSGPTKAQFIAATTSICKSAEASFAPLVKKLLSAAPALAGGGASAANKLVGAVGQLHSIAASSLAKLRALPQPAGDHAAIARFLTPLATIVDSIGTALNGLKSGQGTLALAQLAADQTPAQQVTSAAKHYGLVRCSTLFAALG